MRTTGKLQNLAGEYSFEWEIKNFFALSKQCYICPSFSFAGELWFLIIYPNGRSERNSVGFIEAYLHRIWGGLPISLAWSFSVKTFEGKKVEERQFAYVFGKSQGWGRSKCWKRSEFSEKKSELVPSGVLTLVCHIEHYSKSKDAAGNIATAECSYCKRNLDAEYVSSHEQKCLDKPMRCPTCENAVALRNWFDHECNTARIEATEKLVEDLSYILDSEDHTDVTIRVKHKEFRLHRGILSGRNPYFCSMFNTEMKEKITGIVSIDDCEPNIFESFINFLYTGEAYTLSCDNVCALYVVADKYQEDQLKAECLCFMKREISVDSFVDFIVLALKHDEEELLQTATDFFCKKIKEIIQSEKWQTFMQEYPIHANELHIKALDYYVK